MSNNESFIDEVTEEVRRDQLYAYLKKYGWIAGVVILGIVGGAAWTEYQKATTAAAAQAKGDAIIAAMEANDDASRAAALDALPVGPVSLMLEATSFSDMGDFEAARIALQKIIDDTTTDSVYRDAATYKLALIEGQDASVEEVQATLAMLLNPGHPLRLLAEEQVALALVRAGDGAGALEMFKAIAADAEVNRGLRQRVEGAIVALGGGDAASN